MKSSSTTELTISKSIIILGSPGTGKTTLATLLPKAYFLNADNNINGPIRWLTAQGKLPEFFYDNVLYTDKASLLLAGCSEAELKDMQTAGVGAVPRRCRYRYMALLLNKAAKDPDIESIILDSLTSITEIILDEIRRQANLPLGDPFGSQTTDKPLRIQDWGAFSSLFKNLLFALMGSGKRIVVIGHIKVDKDELTGTLNEMINMPGQFALQISSFFEECWLLYSEENIVGGKKVTKRMIKTSAGGNQQKLGLKSAAGIPTEELKLDTFIKQIV